uniref:Uncharacterized protein n=1 Tax=Hucho hucho TaxID=62062 RepID=A0A4W5PDP7_9TELE
MAEELCTGWFRIVAGSLEIEECKSAIMMEGLKKRTRKAFGIRKKEKGDKDNDSTGSPDREGGSQKKANGAAVNGFSGEIDWDRYVWNQHSSFGQAHIKNKPMIMLLAYSQRSICHGQ